jgi:hypothetical protein
MRPEDDTRSFWVFTHGCGCTTSVLTNAGYTAAGAFEEMYDSAAGAQAAVDRGVTAQLVDAPAYHRVYYPMIERGHTCQAR